ncbi:hypothetical protein PTKIN_Ptkin01aG0283700 [Pterospermum kingtungense]
MLPLMAHGHLIPFLELARKIHQRKCFTITIATTPLNIKYLHSTTTNHYESSIYIAELHFSCFGLPPNSDNTENLPVGLIGTLSGQQLASKPHSIACYWTLLKKMASLLCMLYQTFSWDGLWMLQRL